jgi:hypothetical protein
LNTLTGKSKGWINHPVVQQWKGYEGALSYYGHIMCTEWIHRGFKSTIHEKFCPFPDGKFPSWLGNGKYHSAMRANLLRKDPVWYGKFGWTEDPSTPYFWPSTEGYLNI